MKKVFIEWVDSKSGPSEWEYLEDIETLIPVSCQSIGFLLEDNEEYKTLASTISESQVWGRITIPSCTIKKFEILSMLLISL